MNSRLLKIQALAAEGNTPELKKIFEQEYTQQEIDIALEIAIAYSQLPMAEMLMSIGGDLSANGFQGVYYAVHNNEVEGLKFAIRNGVDINVNSGMLLNCSIETAINTKSIEIVQWLLKNGADPKLLTHSSLQLARQYSFEDLKNLLENVT
jgi:ankyrin repeat protein